MNIAGLRTGIKLELEFFDELGEKVNPILVSQFERVMKENIIVVAAPIYEGNIFQVHIGWTMNVYFIMYDDLYKFKSKVLGRTNYGNIAMLNIEITSEITKIQRRQFFRFECTIPIKYRIVNSLSDQDNKIIPYKDTITRDISGGGLCIKLQEEIVINTIIQCELSLIESKISFYGIVVRSSVRNRDIKYGYEIGVIFRKIAYWEKEEVIKFIFREQRRLRKKGMI